MKVRGLRAYGAIAVGDLQTGGCYDLEPDPPAVAASAVRDHRRCRLTFALSGRRRRSALERVVRPRHGLRLKGATTEEQR